MSINVKFGADYGDLQRGMAESARIVEESTAAIKNHFASMTNYTIEQNERMVSGFKVGIPSMITGIESWGAKLVQIGREATSKVVDHVRNMSREVQTSARETGEAIQRQTESVRESYESIKSSRQDAADSAGAANQELLDSTEKLGVATGIAAWKYGTLGAAIASVLGVAGMAVDHAVKGATAYTEWGTQISDLSAKTGKSIDTLQTWSFVARAAGIDADTLRTGMKNIGDLLANLSTGDAALLKVKSTMEAMGITFTDASGGVKSFEEILLEIADKFQTYEDGTQKAVLANNLFGDSTGNLIGFLSKGSAAIKSYMEYAEAENARLTQSEVAKAKSVTDSENLISGVIHDKNIEIGKYWADLIASLQNDSYEWSAITTDMGNVFKDLAKIVGLEVDKIKLKLGILPDSLKRLRDIAAGANPAVPGETLNVGVPSGATGGKSQAPSVVTVEQLKEELAQKKRLDENFYTWDAAADAAFWREKLKGQKEGSVLSGQIWKELQDARKIAEKPEETKASAGSSAEESWFSQRRKALQEIHDQEENLAKTTVELRRIDISFWQESAAGVEKGPEEWKQAYHEIQALRRQDIQQQRNEQREAAVVLASMKRQEADTAIAIERDNIRTRFELGQIDAQERLRLETELYQREYQQAVNAKYAELNVQTQSIPEQARIYREIEKLQLEHLRRMNQANSQATLEQANKWRGYFSQISGSFRGAISGMISGTMTFGQAVQSIGMGILNVFLGIGEQILVDWLIKDVLKIGSTKAVAGSSAAAYAAEGAAAAGASVAAIPVVGWTMVPEVSAATYATLMTYAALTSIPAAAGGWDVPRDSLAYIHQDEMVLPVHLAEGIRRMSDGGSAGGGGPQLVANIYAWDKRGVERWFRDNPDHLTRAFQRAHRNFAIGSKS